MRVKTAWRSAQTAWGAGARAADWLYRRMTKAERRKARQAVDAVPLKACPYCGRIHERGYRCPRKPVHKTERTEAERGRYTKAWRDKAKEIKERSRYLCAACLADGVYTYDTLEVHHIVPLRERPDLLLDDDNLICLCRRHHEMAESGGIPQQDLYKMVEKRDSPRGEGSDFLGDGTPTRGLSV